GTGGYLGGGGAGGVAAGEMTPVPARVIRGPPAGPSGLRAGPTAATIFEFEVNCWVTVVACFGSSWVSPWTIEIFVWLARLSFRTASCAKCSCSCPRTATGPVSGPSMPTEATHGLVAPPALLVLLLLLPQPATASAPSAAAATITLPFMGTPFLATEILLLINHRAPPGGMGRVLSFTYGL